MKIRDSEERTQNHYIIRYHFASSSYLATLGLTYIEKPPEEEIINDIEHEFLFFIKKYPVPLIASAFDAKGDLIYLTTKGEWPFLCGHLDNTRKIIYDWKHFPESSIPDFQKTEAYRDKIYENIPYKTSEELKEKAIRKSRIQVCFVRMCILLLTSQFQKYWLPLVNDSFSHASKPY